MTFRVEFTPEADADLNRLFDFLLERAQTVEDAMRAYDAIEVIRAVANSHLSSTPFSYRKVGHRPTLRELIVPFGSLRSWSSSLVCAISAKRTSTECRQRHRVRLSRQPAREPPPVVGRSWPYG
jgi:plasmid stabilization system protein ParE